MLVALVVLRVNDVQRVGHFVFTRMISEALRM